jgi:hypothetical protein
MTYFIVAYLCITGQIVLWILFSREGWKDRGIVVGVYLLLSVGLFGMMCEVGPRLERMYDAFLKGSVDANLPVACKGSLDDITAGLRVIPASDKDVARAGVGRKLILRGWIGSEYAKDNGTAVRMIPKGGEGPCLEFQVRTEMRPDVAVYMAQPEMEWGGFQAEAFLPKDLPLGRYRILVECRNGPSRDQFEPEKEIAVVSAAEGAALDAPLEQELAERQRKEQQLVAPTPSPTPKKKSKRRYKAAAKK